MSYITQEKLDDWGVSYYHAMEAARDNLRERESVIARFGDHLYTWMTGDGYDGARILLLDTIRGLELTGDPIAVVPNRDTLLVTGSEDWIGLEMMAEVADKCLDDPRSISAIPLRLDGEEWRPWMPPADHTLYEKFRILEVKSLFGDYAEQKKLLDAYHEDRDIDVHVATYMANETSDKKLLNLCVWPAGVEVLLPKTHLVAFSRPEEPMVACGSWEKVQRIVGHLMTPVDDLYPPRFQVTQFPTDDELLRIGKIAL